MFHHAMMGGYLKPTPVKPYMTYDDHHSTSIIMRKCTTRKATIHIHTGEGGRGSRWVHYIGRGGDLGSFGTPFHAVTKNKPPSNEVWWSLGSYPSMFHHAMRGGYLKPTPLKPCIYIYIYIYMTYDDLMIIWSDPSMFPGAVSPWSLHIYHYEAMQGQGPRFLPTRKTTIHIHRGKRGKGVKMGTLHWVGVGGGLPNLDHIYTYLYTHILVAWPHILVGWLSFPLPKDICVCLEFIEMASV